MSQLPAGLGFDECLLNRAAKLRNLNPKSQVLESGHGMSLTRLAFSAF